MNYTELKRLFEIGRPIVRDSTFSYIHLAYKYKFDNYRLITDGELLIRGKDLNIPYFVKQFLELNGEVLMIANILYDKIISITFRTIKGNKAFIKLGNTKASFYGLGNLSEDFTFGKPILLVEGQLDRDMMSLIYKNTLGIMTNRLSKGQLKVLKYLSNKFILMLDNDDAGILGQKRIKQNLLGCKIYELNKDVRLKDAGDLVKLDITNKSLFNEIVENYKAQISLF